MSFNTARYKSARNANVCVNCNKPAIDGKARCEDHLRKMREYMQKRWSSVTGVKKNRPDVVEIHEDLFDLGRYWLRIVAPNGEIVLSSEVYPTRSNATRAAKRIAKRWGLEIVVP